MRPLTLKFKISLTASLLVTLMMFGSSLLITSFFKQRFTENIKEQQFTIVSQLAAQVDSQLGTVRQELVRLARSIPASALHDPAGVRRLLAARSDGRTEFDGGLALFTRSGELIAATEPDSGKIGCVYPDQDCFRRTVGTGQPQVSDPFLSRGAGGPLVVFTAPLFDDRGRVAAILSGGIDPLKDNFLGRLATIRFGEKGYLYVYNRNRTMIVHLDRNRIAKRDVPVGVNRMFDRALTGFEGTAETLNSRGLRVLVSFRQLKNADWIIGANSILTEALSPVTRAIHYAAAATLAGVVVSNLLIWLLMKYLTAPLLLLTGRIREISGSGWDGKLLPVTSRDETGELATAFNGMMESMAANEAELRRLSQAVEHGPSIVIMTDPNGDILYVNPKFSEVTGYSRAEAVGRNPRFLKSDDMPSEDYGRMWRAITSGEEWRGEFRNRRKNGENYWASVLISSVRDETGAISAFIGVQEDITERKRLEEELKASQAILSEMALHDTLTGLPNRRLLEDRLNLAIARADRDGGLVGLLFLDLDHFKQINDTHGHATGDLLLRAFGEVLSASVRKSDTIARLGGDEFVVMLSMIETPDDAALVARKILGRLKEPLRLDGHEIMAGTSIGIAVYPLDAENADELLRRADAALYRAKEEGRGDLRFHGAE